MSNMNEFLKKAQINFAKVPLTQSPHQALFDAAKSLSLELEIDGKKATQWSKKAEDKYFENGDEFLSISLLTTPRQRFKVWWKDDRKIVKAK